jgi:hypothetical protein
MLALCRDLGFTLESGNVDGGLVRVTLPLA